MNGEAGLMVARDRLRQRVIDRYATRLWVVEGDRVRAYADRVDWMRV